MVPSSSADVARALRGQPKPFYRNYLRRNGGKCGEKLFWYVLTFHHRCFLRSQPSWERRKHLGFRLLCARLATHSFTVQCFFWKSYINAHQASIKTWSIDVKYLPAAKGLQLSPSPKKKKRERLTMKLFLPELSYFFLLQNQSIFARP